MEKSEILKTSTRTRTRTQTDSLRTGMDKMQNHKISCTSRPARQIHARDIQNGYARWINKKHLILFFFELWSMSLSDKAHPDKAFNMRTFDESWRCIEYNRLLAQRRWRWRWQCRWRQCKYFIRKRNFLSRFSEHTAQTSKRPNKEWNVVLRHMNLIHAHRLHIKIS